MPSKPKPDTYRLHKARNCAVVTIHGQNFNLGAFGSPASYEKYVRLIAEANANDSAATPAAAPGTALTVTEVALAYHDWASGYYLKNGKPTGHLPKIKRALLVVRELYGSTQAASFGPLAMRVIQQKLTRAGNARSYINDLCGEVRRLFRWAASHELLPVAVYQALATVPGLKRGRSEAREAPPITPVSEMLLASTLPYLPPVVRDMVQVQRLIGCRPTEVCIMRPCDLDRSAGGVWMYSPSSHKTQHHGRERRIAIGPKAQAILLPYLLRPSDAFCFSLAESDAKRKADLRANRKTKVQPSQLKRRKGRPLKQPQDRYTKDSYNRAVARACAKAARMNAHPRRPEPPKGKTKKSAEYLALYQQYRAACIVYNAKLAGVSWSPNQLRHAAATEIRRRFGIEAAQVALGHSKADVTQVYAERDYGLAAKVAAEIG